MWVGIRPAVRARLVGAYSTGVRVYSAGLAVHSSSLRVQRWASKHKRTMESADARGGRADVEQVGQGGPVEVAEDPDPVGRVREAAGQAGIPRTFR